MTPIQQATERVNRASAERDRLEAKFSEQCRAGVSREESDATAAELMSARAAHFAAEEAREQLYARGRTALVFTPPELRS